VKLTRERITRDLVSFGVVEGDMLFLQADLGQFVKLDGKPSDVILGGIMDVLGSKGTLICPAFTKKNLFWRPQKHVTELQTAAPITGALSNMMMRHEEVLRSTHPTHSVFVLGARSEEVVEQHTDKRAAFAPLRKLIDSNGLQMVLGCAASTPGMASIHLAQFDLGLSQQHLTKHLYRVDYLNDAGEIVRYKLSESPGCSRGFGKQYDAYVKDENFFTGYIGPAWAVATRVKAAYEKDIATLKKNPNCLRCEYKDCIDCSLRAYNKRSIPRMLYANVKKKLRS